MRKNGLEHRLHPIGSWKECATGGYFTVELCLLLPVILLIFMFLYHVLLYQYNSCLQMQDMCLAVIHGAERWECSSQECAQMVTQAMKSEYKGKYFGWKKEVLQLETSKEEIDLSIRGRLSVAVSQESWWKLGTEKWNTGLQMRTKRHHPVVFLRMLHRIEELKELFAEEEEDGYGI